MAAGSLIAIPQNPIPQNLMYPLTPELSPSWDLQECLGRRSATSGRALCDWLEGRFDLIVSPLLLDELRRALSRLSPRPRQSRCAGETELHRYFEQV